MDRIVIENFAKKLTAVNNIKISVLGENIELLHEKKYRINNQDGQLQDTNFLGRNLEFGFSFKGEQQYVAIQLYLNTANYYRVFVFGKDNKMWTSVNLSKGQIDDMIEFDIQIRVTAPQSDSKEQRATRRDAIITELKKCGLKVDKRNHVYFGAYNIVSGEFINTNAEQFIKDLVTIAICKTFTEV